MEYRDLFNYISFGGTFGSTARERIFLGETLLGNAVLLKSGN
jgi:hypothetical protein